MLVDKKKTILQLAYIKKISSVEIDEVLFFIIYSI